MAAAHEAAERVFFDPNLMLGRLDRLGGALSPPITSRAPPNASHFSDLNLVNDLDPDLRPQPLRKHLRRLVRDKSESRIYLPELHRQKPIVGMISQSEDADNVARLYDARSPRHSKSKQPAPKASSGLTSKMVFSSQPTLGSRQARKATRKSVDLDSICSSSLPNGMNMAISSGNNAKRRRPQRSSSLILPNINQFKMEDNLLEGLEVDEDEARSEADAEADDSFAEDMRLAEREVNENWLLETDIKLRMKKFQKHKTELSIRVPDEDPMVSISRRLDEITQMAKPRRDERYVLDRIDPSYKERILKYTEMPIEELRKRKRKHWKLKDRFRAAARLVALLMNCFRQSKIYYIDKTDVGSLRKRLENASKNSRASTYTRSSLGAELQLCLATQPHLRDNKMIKRILWLLRASKAFKGLFPAEMEPEVARHASYEKYDDGRIIAYQGRTPDRFYYVIAGRVAILRQYKLSTGQVTKAMGFLTKGMTTDAEEMEKQWMREDSLICRGQVEVLILDRKAFNFLQHTTQGPPIEFLRSLDLFEDFPVEEFLAHPDAIDYKFYGQGKSIVKDSNRTPWILVVKSGQVKVVRYQSVIDARTSNESKFNTPRIEELGCTRASSHADAMLGVQAKQKKIKESLELPRKEPIEESPSNPHFQTIDVKSPLIYRNRNSANTSQVSKPVLCDFEHDDDGDDLEADKTSSEYQSPVDDKDRDRQLTSALPSSDRDRQLTSALPSSATVTPSSSGKRKATFPSIDSARTDNDTKASSEDQYQPHSLWLTRERTEADPSLPPLGPSALGTFTPRQRKEVQHRRAYLQLDVLNPGDVFGLDHLQPALASEGRGFSLMSDGAEVIMISKRFFLQHADNNTMLKVDTMYKEYISEDEATSALYEQETWDQYKAALWKIMSAPFPAIR